MDLCEHNKFFNWPFSLTWKIHNFSLYLKFIDEHIQSPAFTIPVINDSWRLLLFKSSDAKDYISVYLHRTPSERKSETSYWLNLSILNSVGRLENRCERTIDFKKFDYWEANKFIKRKSLVENQETMLPKDTLTLHCVIRETFQYGGLLNVHSFITTLEKLYEKEKRYLSDIMLNSKKNKTHSKDLSASERNCMIPVLHKWFKHLYSEKIDADLFCSLENIIENATLSKVLCQNGLPRRLASDSHLPTQCTSFTWYIKKFSDMKQEEKFFSPGLSCGSNTWKFLFHLSVNDDGKEIIDIFVCPMSLYMDSKKIVKCKICVVNESGRFPLWMESVHLYDNNGQWKLPSSIKTEILKNDKKSYLSNDILILFCSLSVFELGYKLVQSWTVTENHDGETLAQFRKFCLFRQMRKDMMALLESGLYGDVKLRVGQCEMSAHKTILSERSSLFKRRIKVLRKSRGNEKMTLEITDLDEKHLKDLLEYIYSGFCCTLTSPCFISAALTYGVDENIVLKLSVAESMTKCIGLKSRLGFSECCIDEELERSLDDQRRASPGPYEELDTLRVFDPFWRDTA